MPCSSCKNPIQDTEESINCGNCNQLFHAWKCTKRFSALANIQKLSGDIFWRYTCAACSKDPHDLLLRLRLSWYQPTRLHLHASIYRVDLVHISLAHLSQHQKAENMVEGMKFFHWRQLCDFIELHWNSFWDKPKEGNWQNSVAAALSTFASRRFRSGKDLRGSLTGHWTLLDNLQPVDFEVVGIERAADYEVDALTGLLIPLKGRHHRNAPDDDGAADHQSEKEARRLRRQMKKLAESYVFSNLDFDRPNPSGPMHFSVLPTHTAPEVKLTDDMTGASNAKGYCMARTTHGFHQAGNWYFEVRINPSASGNVRVGVAQILAESQGPVGFDEFAYGMRDRDGAKVHCGQAQAYARPFNGGDIIGVLLSIPDIDATITGNHLRQEIEAQWPPLRFGQYKVRQEIFKEAQLSFLINGESFGPAFVNLYQGKYYPAVSMFGEGSITLNLGPHFEHQPINSIPACCISSQTN